jgi:purine-binding chemotaxis protein CheW
MDLAKIRQKARQGQNSASPADSPSPPVEVMDEVKLRAEIAPQQADLEDDFFSDIDMPVDVTPPTHIQQPRRRNPHLSPIEVIMSGRETSGCNEDIPFSTEEQSQTVVEDYEEFLCIRVSNEIYGINIMKIKEIIKPREVTEVPRTPSFVSGVVSLRGVIIPIFDMNDRLGLVRESATGRERVVVVKHGDDYTGLLVDEVIQVVRIAKDNFESAPAVLEGINRDFVNGIGRADNRMIILLNLETIADINHF